MDPKQAAATIVAYMNSRDIDVPDNVRLAADDYARACQAVNTRLVACDELLKSNQRSEAIRQVQLEPDALQLYNALDIANRNQWTDIATQVGLPVPPPLNALVARRLHGAFTAEQAVAPLLVQHRLLAVSRAPLRRRLEVLRLLAKAEPTNLGWTTDVRAYETARFAEIRAELEDPDNADLHALHDELTGPWSSPPPLDLVAAVKEQHADELRESGEAALNELNPRLLRAIADGDLDGARRLAAQARATADRHNLPKNSRLLAPANQARRWIEDVEGEIGEEDEFMRAVETLRHAIEENIDAGHIRRCHEVVMGYTKFVIPDDVADAYEAWSRSRGQLIWIGAAAGVIAVLLGIALYLIFVRK